MDLTRVIISPVITEKAERLKANPGNKVYTLIVSNGSTKIDVRNALKRFYDVDVKNVRVSRVQPKTRTMGMGTMEKRHTMKKVMVTLTKDSKVLDLAAFQTA
jgi:large subunit ribosomal protein L23